MARFQALPSVARPGETVELNATDAHDPDGAVVRYEWDYAGTGDFEEGPAVVQRCLLYTSPSPRD